MSKTMTITIDASEAKDSADCVLDLLRDTVSILDALEKEQVGDDNAQGFRICEISKENPISVVIASLAGLSLFNGFIGGMKDIQEAPSLSFSESVVKRVAKLGSHLEKHNGVTLQLETDDVSVQPTRIIRDHANDAIANNVGQNRLTVVSKDPEGMMDGEVVANAIKTNRRIAKQV